MNFRDVPVGASGRISDKLMDSLEPFDMADVQPFDIRYLLGRLMRMKKRFSAISLTLLCFIDEKGFDDQQREENDPRVGLPRGDKNGNADSGQRQPRDYAMAVLETYSASASSSCVRPLLFRNSCNFSLNSIRSLPAVIHRIDSVSVQQKQSHAQENRADDIRRPVYAGEQSPDHHKRRKREDK